jgi:hypothetical protein
MSSEQMEKMDETLNKIFKILAEDELTPAQHVAILAKLITLIFQLAKERGVISEEALLRAKIKIATAILQS